MEELPKGNLTYPSEHFSGTIIKHQKRLLPNLLSCFRLDGKIK